MLYAQCGFIRLRRQSITPPLYLNIRNMKVPSTSSVQIR